MAKQNRSTLKSYFETGDIPTQENYTDFIDSTLNLSEVNSDISVTNITASGNVSSSGDLIISSSLTFGASASIDFDSTLTIGNISSNESIKIVNDKIIFKVGGQEAMILKDINDSILIGYGGINSTYIGSHNNVMIRADSANNRTFLYNEVTIGSSSLAQFTGDALFTVSGSSKFYGNVTASGNISASGTIYANNFQSAGGDVAGISFTDDLVLTGHLTASGNISASGTIHANKIIVDYASGIYGQDLNGNTSDLIIGNYNDSNLLIGNNTTPNILMNHTTIIGNLTASGNISSSGTIISNTLKVDGSQVDFTNLPTSDPGVIGRLYISSSFIKISL